ncbi:MAG TPA: methyl-accepting chemotaxis protein [Fibrobacteria bacterium]|nr:methyl-accepting chemotaxis protein [Fibrobacteria bacterium]
MTWLNGLTLGKKITGLVLLLISLLAGVGIYSIINAKNSAEGARTISEDRLYPAIQIGEILTNNSQQIIQVGLSTMHDPRLPDSKLHTDHSIDKHFKAVAELRAKNAELWNSYKDRDLTPDEKVLANKFEAARKELREKGTDAALKLQGDGHFAEANDLRVHVIQPLSNEVIKVGKELLALHQKTGQEEVAKQVNSASDMTNMLILGGIIGLIFVATVSYFIITSVTSSISHAVATIGDGALQITSASDQVASSSTSLAQGASEQASSLEVVNATLEETTASVTLNTENARQADLLAKSANQSAKEGLEKGEYLVASMNEVTESAAKIANIVKTIDQIAFQVNLLALNAAVEAARAGEQGLGFAIVADEVRNLAQRVASSAKETGVVIDEAIGQIKKSSDIAHAASNSFKEIEDKAKKVSSLIGEVALSSKEQTKGLAQLSTALSQIDQVTQQVAANSEEAAAASEELNAQAESALVAVAGLTKMVGIKTETVHVKGSGKESRQPPQRQAGATRQLPKAHKKESEDRFPESERVLPEFEWQS